MPDNRFLKNQNYRKINYSKQKQFLSLFDLQKPFFYAENKNERTWPFG